MRALFEIYRLELLSFARSKAMALLVAFTAAWMVALPLVLHDDGTAEGAFQLHIRYSLGVVFSVVAVSLVAAAAGTLAKDREAKRLQLSMVRPVRHFSIALGRILAVTSCGAATLALACAIACLQTGRARTCDHVVSPALEDPRVAAERMFAEDMEKYPDFGKEVERVGKDEIMRYLVQYVKDTYQTIETGASAQWRFDGVPEGAALSVLMRPTDLYGRIDKVGGTFRFGALEGRLVHVNKTVVRVPLDIASTNAAEAAVLTFDNTGTLPVTIQPRRDIKILAAADAFGWNAFRAWIAMTSILSFAVALAVFLGSCLGRSVAVFAAMSLLVASVLTETILDDYPDPTTAGRIDRLGLKLAAATEYVTSPINVASPVTSLAENECVEPVVVLKSAAGGLVFYPLLFAFLSGLAMSRKLD